ncbi:hypothetical protein OCAE111667_15230 [Occultella aeris]|uniref:DUF2269 domain-containing protein n=1 Tax=Occultella aeris TaxID=2761496 RepID=A0A7M4DRD0_9MICO|nr:hypothetical protein [Occultella aeris]VZO40024.1 hypothetical protein HALOF300_04725 [Occultella aeris]
MTVTTPVRHASPESRPTPSARRVLPRLGARARRITLIVHLASAGAWLGMDVVLGILVMFALNAPSTPAAALAIAIGTFVGWPLVGAALLTLLSGVVLGLGSKYGLVRYRWVLVKLIITLVLIGLVVGVLVPSVAQFTTTASAALGSSGEFELDRQMVFPPVVSSLALLFAMTLSVVKPWGRRRGTAAAR